MQLGHSVALALWVLTALSLILVALRVYTRVRLIHFFVLEDHLYVWTSILLLAFTASIQVSIRYGLGQSFWTLDPDDGANAIFWTFVASTFAITANAFAKMSMGFFLLRVVPEQTHKIALWVLMSVTVALSTANVVMVWTQTTPARASWDVLRTQGVWNFDIKPFTIGVGAWSSTCDFFFAAFPWLFIWSLHMPRKDKLILAGGMSVGVIAGVCGIMRTVALNKAYKMDYTVGFSEYYVWLGGEVAVALVCLAVPTLRPLYKKRRDGKAGGYEPAEGSEQQDAGDWHRAQLAMYEAGKQRARRDSLWDLEFAEPADHEDMLQIPHARDSTTSSHTVVGSAPSDGQAPPTKPAPVHIIHISHLDGRCNT